MPISFNSSGPNFKVPPIDWSVLGDIGSNIASGLEQNQLASVLKDFNGDYNAAASALMRMGKVDLASKVYAAGAMADYRNIMAGVAQQKVDLSPASQAQKWLDENIPGTKAPPPVAPQPTPSPDFGMSPATSTPMELGPSGNPQLGTPQPIPAGPNGPTGAYGSSYATPSGMDPRLVNAPKSVQDVLAPAQAMEQLNKEADLKVKRQEEEPTDWALTQQADQNLSNMERNIRQLINVDDKGNVTPSAGLARISGNRSIGGIQTRVPNYILPDVSLTARDADSTLKTSVVEIGLNTLAQMRAASAQGASGMGQLAIQESQWLQQSLAALQESNSTPQLARNLNEVLKHSQNLRAALRQKFQMTHDKPFTGLSQTAINQTPNENTSGMDVATEPLPGDEAIPGASILNTNPNAYSSKAAYASSQESISKLVGMVRSGAVSKQAAIALMKRDQIPDNVIQRILEGL